ncbi:MAG: hypothetical protein ACOZHQ_07795 [Thermodesulfobacteriota bacterium]
MATIGKNVKILKGFALMGLVLGLAAPALAADPYVVTPVNKAEEMRLLPSSAWPPPEAEQGGLLLKLSYLRGLMDALQYAQVSPRAATQALNELKGLDLNELAAAVDRYYLADPRRRELPPAAVVLRILPQQQGRVEPTPLAR